MPSIHGACQRLDDRGERLRRGLRARGRPCPRVKTRKSHGTSRDRCEAARASAFRTADRSGTSAHGRPLERLAFALLSRPRGGADTLSGKQLPVIYLARHGETEWTVSGRHTGRTDLPLTQQGEAEARRLGERLRGQAFTSVLTSPLRRAVQTCATAGFGASAEIEPDLVEWDYGAYEGRTSADIQAESPGWQLFRDGCPRGESPGDVGSRADHVIRRVRTTAGNVLIFSSGHFLRVFAARWLGLEPGAGRYFLLGTASLSAVGYEHDLSEPAIRLWDENPNAPRPFRSPAWHRLQETLR